MPIYEFECDSCRQITEAMRKFSDPPLTVCPHCGGKLEKLISMNSFQLKGGGWYVTDYARKKGDSTCPAKSAKTDKPAANGSAGSSADSGAAPACSACKSAEKGGCPASTDS
ncbi:MAG: zinc ribbon domain-containing protein [Deltaproteobacteria bacterium]|jgi:putative FmdB family regulatory protein|nr:zinc ribbon domain-containing protein [Deltaproteobacteria bacterium]